MDKIKFIRDVCIKANKEIVELKFGCEVKYQGTRHTVISRSPHIDDGDMWLYTDTGGIWTSRHNLTEIIGRPIRLADVLLATITKEESDFWNPHTDGTVFIGFKRQGGFVWNLKNNNLENQPEATIDFIYDILK